MEELSKVATTTVKDNEKDSEPALAPADGSNDSPTGEGALSGGKIAADVDLNEEAATTEDNPTEENTAGKEAAGEKKS